MWKFSHWKNKNATLCCFATALCKCFIFCFCFADFFPLIRLLSCVFAFAFACCVFVFISLENGALVRFHSHPPPLLIPLFSMCLLARTDFHRWCESRWCVFVHRLTTANSVQIHIHKHIIVLFEQFGYMLKPWSAMRTKLSTENIVDSNIGTANNTIDISSRSRSSSGNNNKNDRHASSSSSNRD